MTNRTISNLCQCCLYKMWMWRSTKCFIHITIWPQIYQLLYIYFQGHEFVSALCSLDYVETKTGGGPIKMSQTLALFSSTKTHYLAMKIRTKFFVVHCSINCTSLSRSPKSLPKIQKLTNGSYQVRKGNKIRAATRRGNSWLSPLLSEVAWLGHSW